VLRSTTPSPQTELAAANVCGLNFFAFSLALADLQSAGSVTLRTTFLNPSHVVPFGDFATTVVMPFLLALNGPVASVQDPRVD
jgi:hypothetical protein